MEKADEEPYRGIEEPKECWDKHTINAASAWWTGDLPGMLIWRPQLAL